MICNHRQLYGTSYLFVSFALTGQFTKVGYKPMEFQNLP
jgi:hypothetical protein